MPSKKSKSDRLIALADRYPSESKLELYRNLYLGASAACLVLLTQVLGVSAKDDALQVSLVCSASAMPIWLALASFFEFYIMLGPKSYAHRTGKAPRTLMTGMFMFAGLAMTISIGAFLYHLLPTACYAFVAAIVAAFAAYVFFHEHLANWYFERHLGDGADST